MRKIEGTIGDIAQIVADIVFRSLTAWADADWNEHKRSYILGELILTRVKSLRLDGFVGTGAREIFEG